jgi:YidC/Oxa1 family membrane protein insertase
LLPQAPGLPSSGTLSAEKPLPQLPPAVTVIGEAEERDITIETARVRAVFTNRGGRIRHWWLKEYKNAAGQMMDLVPANTPTPLPLPFSLRVDDAATTARLNDSIYKVTQSDRITFDLETTEGLRVHKAFVLTPDGYEVYFTTHVMQGGETLNPTVEWGPGLGDDIAQQPPGSFLSPNYTYPPQAIYHRNGSRNPDRVAATALAGGLSLDGDFLWAGLDDHYFISAIIKPSAPVHFESAAVAFPSATQPPVIGHYVTYSVRLPAPPESARFFFGPKKLDALRAVDPQFTKAIYFGMFSFLAVPLLDGLKKVHEVIGNWGWSIIALTILINLVMFPLRHKSVVSMRRMQELQPQMKAIQDRYAKYKITDPERQKMNQEVMELYKAKGVNPASGCVPMLLTMPFLFAFYSMLSQAIELRGADFGGWIHDLAAHDPYYITPLLMGATMVWQQKITPSTADPTQQKIMMIMPFMFTFIFLGQPSGLAIYWLVSNLWGIGQQYFTNYLIGPPKVHNVRPPAERKTKKAAATD